ncbi:hypothetical protein ACYPKM_00245 [Pseudomonas aeruginosa]
MKVQLSLVNPDLVPGPGNQTLVFGIIKTEQPISSYDMKIMVLNLDDPIPSVSIADSGQNFLKREDKYGNVHQPWDIKGMLTCEGWHHIDHHNPAGEIALLETEFPGDTGVYTFTGILKGNHEELKNFSERILQADLPDHPAEREFTPYPLQDAYRSAVHEMGNHLDYVLRLPIWGFGPLKYGMNVLTSKQEALKMFNATCRYTDTGEVRDEDRWIVSRDEQFHSYLVEMKKLRTPVFRQWVTEAERAEEDRLGKIAINKILAKDYSPSLQS